MRCGGVPVGVGVVGSRVAVGDDDARAVIVGVGLAESEGVAVGVPMDGCVGEVVGVGVDVTGTVGVCVARSESGGLIASFPATSSIL
jgi:hypothetical protein